MAKKILIVIILFLIATNVTTFYFLSNEKKVEKIEIPDNQLGRFFREELDLNQEQHGQFRTYRQAFHSQSSQIIADLQSVREEMLDELANASIDKEKLQLLSDSLGQLHSKLKHQTFEYYLNMKGVCNTQQQEKLYLIFKSMISTDSDVKLPAEQKHRNN